MRTLFTICGRAGSKGITNKNIRNFLGKPLPLYALSVVDLFLKNEPGLEYDIAVNTDSSQLKQILEDSKMREVVYIPRKEELGGDVVSKIEVIKDCLIMMEKKEHNYDMVIDLDITCPLRRMVDLKNVFEEKNNSDFDAVFTVAESRRNPYFNMVKKNENGTYEKVIKSEFTARQQAPEIFDMNAAIYAFSPKFLKQGKGLFDGKCGIVKMEDTGILDLDRENDFELMEVIARYLFESKESFRTVYENIK